MTKFEKIKAMNEEEFAEWLIGFVCFITESPRYICLNDKEKLLDLLRQEHIERKD